MTEDEKDLQIGGLMREGKRLRDELSEYREQVEGFKEHFRGLGVGEFVVRDAGGKDGLMLRADDGWAPVQLPSLEALTSAVAGMRDREQRLEDVTRRLAALGFQPGWR